MSGSVDASGSVAARGGLEAPRWTWVLSAAVIIVFAAMSTFGHGHATRTHPVAIGLIAASTLPWVLSALDVRIPPLPLWLLAVVPLAVLNIGGEALGIAGLGDEEANQFSLMIALFAVGEAIAHAPLRVASVVGVLGLGTIVGRRVAEPDFDSWIFWLVAGGAMALLTGGFLRWQQATLTELRAAQAALAQESAQRERHRMAREVHDVIAHTLTVTMMHLTAARMAIGRDDAQAREALSEAERLGRQSLTDLRRTVGLLRTETEHPSQPPMPSVGDVDELASSYVTAGMDVSLELGDELEVLGPAEQLAVYRIVQEALANAAKHAPGAPVEARIVRQDHDVVVDVRNATRSGGPGVASHPNGTGTGIVGMRERVSLLGGDLAVGPDGDGWSVRARFPHTEVDGERRRCGPRPRG